jgi:hypothetical protein
MSENTWKPQAAAEVTKNSKAMKRVKRAEAEFAHSVLQVAVGEDDVYKWQKSAAKKDSSANRSNVELAEAEFARSVLQVAGGEDDVYKWQKSAAKKDSFANRSNVENALLLAQQAIAEKAVSTNSHAIRLAEGEFAQFALLVAVGGEAVLEAEAVKAATEAANRKEYVPHENMS